MISETPNRKKFSYVQTIKANPELVFSLLCPVREVDWVPGWPLIKVISNSGLAEPECIFITKAEPSNSIWIISNHDPVNYQVAMYKITPDETVTKLEISLASKAENISEVTISYEYTAIGESGENILKGYTKEWYNKFMLDWENSMNHFITTGKILK